MLMAGRLLVVHKAGNSHLYQGTKRTRVIALPSAVIMSQTILSKTYSCKSVVLGLFNYLQRQQPAHRKPSCQLPWHVFCSGITTAGNENWRSLEELYLSAGQQTYQAEQKSLFRLLFT